MTFSVDYHWDKLDCCVVGKTYPPDFFKFVKNSKVRNLMEKISIETNDDLEKLSDLLNKFDVQVLRPELKNNLDSYDFGNRYLPPPLTPRDDMAIIGDTFFMPSTNKNGKWNSIRGDDWPIDPPSNYTEWNQLNQNIINELHNVYNIENIADCYYRDYSSYKNVERLIKSNRNKIVYDTKVNSAMVYRLGKKLVFGTWNSDEINTVKQQADLLFSDYNNYVIDSQGHLDGTIYPVTDGLLLATSAIDINMLNNAFPGWQIIFLDDFDTQNQSNSNYRQIKKFNQGKWLIPEQYSNKDTVDYIDNYFSNWLGDVSESVFGLNILSIDKKNIAVSQENKVIFKIFEQYDVTPHVVKMRHSKFWDSGIHCMTNDLNRISDGVGL